MFIKEDKCLWNDMTCQIKGTNYARQSVNLVRVPTGSSYYDVPMSEIKQFEDPWTKDETKQKETKMDLFEFKIHGETKYGTYLATNSAGNFVMEEKGTGTVHTVAKGFVKKVLPYTISIVFFGSTTKYDYLAKAGKYQVGDIYAVQGKYGLSFAQIVGVDTESEKATVEFAPTAKVITESL